MNVANELEICSPIYGFIYFNDEEEGDEEEGDDVGFASNQL